MPECGVDSDKEVVVLVDADNSANILKYVQELVKTRKGVVAHAFVSRHYDGPCPSKIALHHASTGLPDAADHEISFFAGMRAKQWQRHGTLVLIVSKDDALENTVELLRRESNVVACFLTPAAINSCQDLDKQVAARVSPRHLEHATPDRKVGNLHFSARPKKPLTAATNAFEAFVAVRKAELPQFTAEVPQSLNAPGVASLAVPPVAPALADAVETQCSGVGHEALAVLTVPRVDDANAAVALGQPSEPHAHETVVEGDGGPPPATAPLPSHAHAAVAIGQLTSEPAVLEAVVEGDGGEPSQQVQPSFSGLPLGVPPLSPTLVDDTSVLGMPDAGEDRSQAPVELVAVPSVEH